MTTVNKTAGGRKPSQSPAATTSAASKASSPTANSCTRTDFALLSLKGVLVKAALRSGDFLEGIFDALDHDKRTISLRLVRKLSSVGGEETGGQKEATITSLALSELICLTSEPVNFAEATGGQTFATDAEISGSAGPLRERELARWEGSSEGAEALVGSLEEEAGPPGVGWDQFDANKRLFGVETSFDEAQYTTIIDRNSEEYRKLERKAERLAAEITGSTANAAATGNINNVHLAEERGLHVDDGQMDEEDRYGAVVRPPSSPGRTMESAPGKSPVSFREAALSGSTSMVTMPKYTTSASSSTVKSGQSSGQLSSPTLSESEAGAPAPLSSSARPRKSIANLHVDPTALEQARESVNQATDAIQRRMSQVQVEIGKEEQEKKAALNPNAAVFVPGAPFSSSNPGASVAVNSAASETRTLSTSIGASASSGAGKTTTFNPNAAAYVPSSYVPSAPAYGYGYGYNPHHYASNSYQQPYTGGGTNAGYYNQGSYYNPYQYYRYHHPSQGSHSQQHYQQAPLPLEPQSQLNDGTATSAPSHPSARSGGNIEVMGLLLGKVDGQTMIVMDSFALPVEGTETRVNAHVQAYEYMVTYTAMAKQVNRLENVIGWYHSHPGYGCWLSGIDVSTQMLNQQFQEPWVAIVVDPTRTVSSGKVNLGAFRTYPKNYKPPDEGPSEYQSIPLNKIEDFGVHCKQYYSLDVSYFKSILDKSLLEFLWNRYWVNTLSSSSLLTNADYTTGQIFDIADKLEEAESQLGKGGFIGAFDFPDTSKQSEDKLSKVCKDSKKTVIECIHGLMSQVLKDQLVNKVKTTN